MSSKRRVLTKASDQAATFGPPVLVKHHHGNVFNLGIDGVAKDDRLHDGNDEHEEERRSLSPDVGELLDHDGGKAVGRASQAASTTGGRSQGSEFGWLGRRRARGRWSGGKFVRGRFGRNYGLGHTAPGEFRIPGQRHEHVFE